MYAALTEASVEALNNLRSTANFQWYLIPLLAFVIYVYVVDIERKRWDIVLAGIAFFGIEFAWEMFNALVLHWSGRSAMWTTPGDTAFLILVGLTIEISIMFAIAGVIITRVLPQDKKQKVLGIPNRLFYPVVFGLGCVFVEVILNQWGVLVWEYSWWSWPHIWLIIVAYCVGFGLCVLFFDIKSMRVKGVLIGVIYTLNIICFIVFANLLGWI